MPKFVSKPTVKEGISPTDPLDLATKEYVDGIFTYANGGGPELAVRLHISVDAGTVELPVAPTP